ncbi:shikimate 5-dehydrogenase [Roseomonas marmotae]|uniref:Shikimate 5-dehydrogenase n=1 Tax=Roseomonas marmotae TaxID=2768161 RepID=A0ABS3K9A9_9PROT|nr:shikimate 5-dehydrogenase [Roseomonas marmotae]MBO1074052.1 shikimate 5-dehydrogenase [Roseomonas marmotae]QTI78838.1 shikimate 5-dehydrogenase [Roseomonas marmotae]
MPDTPSSRCLIGRDTQLCMSLAGRPGNFGSRFHNHLYESLELDFVYKAFTTQDLRAAIGGIRALGIRGCGISMPFKEACIPLLDSLAPSAEAIASVNTIVNDGGHLRGHNTDYAAIAPLLARHGVPPETPFAARGSGGMAKAVVSALRDAGFRQGTVIARNEAAGRRLAESCGYRWQAEVTGAPLLLNITPIGMAGGPEAGELAFPEEVIAGARFVFDVVALPAETPLIRHARALGKTVITGAEVAVLQALEQFILYTGVTPGTEQVEAAARFARG